MEDESSVSGDNKVVEGTQNRCDRDQALTTLNLLEKGAKRAFLEDELGVEETKNILDQITRARESCQAGDSNACEILNSLVQNLTNP